MFFRGYRIEKDLILEGLRRNKKGRIYRVKGRIYRVKEE